LASRYSLPLFQLSFKEQRPEGIADCLLLRDDSAFWQEYLTANKFSLTI
jgi:hypothetical protein